MRTHHFAFCIVHFAFCICRRQKRYGRPYNAHHPATSAERREQDRRRRGDRAAGERREGAAGKLGRRRRDADRCHDRKGRQRDDPRGRQRLRHRRGRVAAGRRKPCDEQNSIGRRLVLGRHARLPRRSAGLDRRSQPAGHSQPARPMRPAARSWKWSAAPRSRSFPVGCPVGTTIEVRNLFFNTPVRHKFLRSPQTEMGHSIEAVTRLALAHPGIHFTLSHNGRLVHDLPPVGQRPRPHRRVFRRRVGRRSHRDPQRSGRRDARAATSPIRCTAARPAGCNTCFSTAGRFATVRCSTRWARRIGVSCSPAGSRFASCGSTCRRKWSTSTCIPRSRKSASRIPAACTANYLARCGRSS